MDFKLAGETFAKSVTQDNKSVGADLSVFAWTFAQHKEAIIE